MSNTTTLKTGDLKEGVDFLVAGGGIPGICAAIQAGRLGLKTVLVEKEWALGGNGGPLLGVNWGGCAQHNPAWLETGVVEELNCRVFNACALTTPGSYAINTDPMVDHVFTDILAEAGVIVLRRHAVLSAATAPTGSDQHRITTVTVLNLENLEPIAIPIDGFVLDDTGDAAVAAMANAETVMGRESRAQTGERSAPEEPDTVVSAASITALTADAGVPCPFVPPPGTPPWNPDKPATTFRPDRHLNFLFQVDEGGESAENHPLHSPQELYLRLRTRIYSMWNYMKNVLYPEQATNHKLIWISPLLGRRESRRIVGDYMLTQTDAEEGRTFPDTVGICGHGLDYHPPSFDGGYECIFYSGPVPFNVPFRCIYSRNVENLFSAGRAISATHLAFSGTRIMRTGAMLGQAAAMAAKLCRDKGVSPRELGEEHAGELQQALIAQDVWLPGIPLRDATDLAASATVNASSEATATRRHIPADGAWQRAGAGLGAAVYTVPDMLTDAAVYIRNASDTAAVTRVFVGYGQSPLPDWGDARERAAGEPYAFRPPVKPYWITEIEVQAERMVDVPPGFEGWLDVGAPTGPFPSHDIKRFTQGVVVAVAGDVDVLVAGHGLDTLDPARQDDHGNWHVRPGPVPVIRLDPDPTPGRASNVIDGHIHRQALAHLHAWVSAPGEAMPQWLELDLGAPRAIDRIQLRFDTTERLWANSYMALGAAAARQCVRDYQIAVETDGRWQTVVHEEGNFLRFREHSLSKPICGRRVRVTVTAANGPEQPARIYGVHVYGH